MVRNQNKYIHLDTVRITIFATVLAFRFENTSLPSLSQTEPHHQWTFQQYLGSGPSAIADLMLTCPDLIMVFNYYVIDWF